MQIQLVSTNQHNWIDFRALVENESGPEIAFEIPFDSDGKASVTLVNDQVLSIIVLNTTTNKVVFQKRNLDLQSSHDLYELTINVD